MWRGKYAKRDSSIFVGGAALCSEIRRTNSTLPDVRVLSFEIFYNSAAFVVRTEVVNILFEFVVRPGNRESGGFSRKTYESSRVRFFVILTAKSIVRRTIKLLGPVYL